MRNEKVEYPRGNKDLVMHAPAVCTLIKKETKSGGLLPKSIDAIRSEIVSGLCILVLIDEKVIGYAAIILYSEMKLTKISSYVVDIEEREQGIGNKLARKIYNLAKELYPGYKAITVVSPAIANKFERLGMVQIAKEKVPKEFLDDTSIRLNTPNPNKIILIEP